MLHIIIGLRDLIFSILMSWVGITSPVDQKEVETTSESGHSEPNKHMVPAIKLGS